MPLVSLLLAPEERTERQNETKTNHGGNSQINLTKYISFHNHLVTKSFNNQTAFFVTKQRKWTTVRLRFENQEIYVDLF